MNWKDYLTEFTIIILAAVCVGLLVAIAFQTPAKAHSFYDAECCSNKDCAPVTTTQKHPEGDLMTTAHGTVLVRPTDKFSKKVSPDGVFHVCMRQKYPYNGQPTMEIICIYYPQLY